MAPLLTAPMQLHCSSKQLALSVFAVYSKLLPNCWLFRLEGEFVAWWCIGWINKINFVPYCLQGLASYYVWLLCRHALAQQVQGQWVESVHLCGFCYNLFVISVKNFHIELKSVWLNFLLYAEVELFGWLPWKKLLSIDTGGSRQRIIHPLSAFDSLCQYIKYWEKCGSSLVTSVSDII